MSWLLLTASLVCANVSYDTVTREKLDRLQQDAQQGRRWAWGWGAALSVSAAGQLTLAAVVDDEDFRIDRLVGGVTSLVGVLAVAVTHPRAMRALRRLGACPSREEVDLALTDVAKEERFARSWYQHVLGAAFNMGTGLYLGLAHDHWLGGALHAISGTAVSEAMILTRPHRVADFSFAPSVSPSQGSYGLTFAIRL